MGDRKDRTTSSGSWDLEGGGILYVRFVVDASKVAPKNVGYDTLKLQMN